jgi:acyl-CoA reductase-like NAD-dependent aldehyde dehydrogenase
VVEIVDDADAAVACAKATAYGLSAGIITSNAERFRCGRKIGRSVLPH